MTRGRKIKILLYRLHQQGHKCFYCGWHFVNAKLLTDITIDHVMPRHLGAMRGLTYDVPENVVACCTLCNHRKDGREPTDTELLKLTALNHGFTAEGMDAHFMRVLQTPFPMELSDG